jgi:urease accessory protein
MLNLRLLQLGDSALPVGGYTHSWGLETAIARERVHDAASLECWTSAWLRKSVGPFDGVIVASVCRAAAEGDWAEVARANEIVATSLSPPTLRSASREMGEQLEGLSQTWQWSRAQVDELPHPDTGWNYCVIFGVVAAAAGATPREALATYLNQAALGMIAAGVRGIPLGHTQAQQILAYLHDTLTELTERYAEQPLETAGSGCPYYEVLCHEQSRLYTRLFRS